MRTGGEIGLLAKRGNYGYNKYIISMKEGICVTYTFRPRGVCSQLMEIETEDGILKGLSVMGGCSGNLQGIARLVEGMPVEEVIRRLEGIRCGFKNTSCPDQLAKALKAMRAETDA